MVGIRILKAGLSALVVESDNLETTQALFEAINNAVNQAPQHPGSPFAAIRQTIPAARTVLVEFDVGLATGDDLAAAFRQLDTASTTHADPTVVSIPVVYDGEDLAAVAQQRGISVQALVDWHAATPWRAAFAGFAPGFVYLTGGEPDVNTPRKDTPRLEVPAGAVGLAGPFSGVYPRRSSGGWQLIGTTALAMWDEHKNPPAAIQPGNLVTFVPTRERIASPAAPTRTRMAPAAAAGTVSPHDAHGCLRRGTSDDAQIGVLRVERTGMLALFEDDGRQSGVLGVTGSGSADRRSAHLANALVGNSADEPVIEITDGDARFTALADTVVAVTGAPAPIVVHTPVVQAAVVHTPELRGQTDYNDVSGGGDGPVCRTSVLGQQAVLLRHGESIEIGVPESGLRDYLALQGGFSVERVLGSASTDTMAQLGPDPLTPGDIMYAACHRHATVGRPLPWMTMPARGGTTSLEITLGPRDAWFTDQAVETLYAQSWSVTPQSNRVGLRLHGEQTLERRIAAELPSEGTVPGSLEIAKDGQPVLFLCDQPVTGGYPVIAVLTPHSRMVAAQLPAGAHIRFIPAGTRLSHAARPVSDHTERHQ